MGDLTCLNRGAGDLGDSGGAATLRLQERKRDIAQQLAMTPETLSRLMRGFEARGVLAVRGYQVEVRDVAGLRALAGADTAQSSSMPGR